MPVFETEATVGEIEKNARYRVLGRVMRIDGRPMVDVRLFAPDASGQRMVPTKAGVCLPSGKAGELHALTGKLLAACADEGEEEAGEAIDNDNERSE